MKVLGLVAMTWREYISYKKVTCVVLTWTLQYYNERRKSWARLVMESAQELRCSNGGKRRSYLFAYLLIFTTENAVVAFT